MGGLHHTLPPNVHPAHYANIPAFITQVSLYGYAGVDVFFVIIGYIMAQTTQFTPSGLRSGSEFVLHRYLRIYSGYWPVFALALSLGLGIWQEPGIDLWGSFWLLPQYKYLLNVAWTLTYELGFYLLVGVLMVFTRERSTQVMAALFVALLALVLVQHQQNFYQNATAENVSLVIDMFLTSPLILEFMAGYLLQRWFARHPSQSLLLWGLFTAIAMAASVSMNMWGDMQGVGMSVYLYYPERVLLLGLTAVGLLALAVISPEWRAWPMRWMQRLGDASYAL